MLYFLLLLLLLFSGFRKGDTAAENVLRINRYLLIWGIVVLGLSEVLSLVKAFTIHNIRLAIVFGMFVMVARFRKQWALNLPVLVNSETYRFAWRFRWTLIPLSLMLAAVLTYSPNNWDANTYHLPRMIYWLQQGSLDHYPTHIFRQAYQPPFAEVQLAWVYASFGPVSLLNGLQLVYFTGVLSILYLIIQQQLPRSLAIGSTHIILLALPIFSLVLQSVFTKNDVILLYFLLVIAYALINWIRYDRLSNFLIAAPAALAILTKGTSYIYFAPTGLVALVFLIRYKRLEMKNLRQKLPSLFFSLILAMLLTIPMYHRNFSLTGGFSGQDDHELRMYKNEKIGVPSAVSNTIKNISLHIQPPLISLPVTESVVKLHQMLHLPDPSDTALNFEKEPYQAAARPIKNYFEGSDVPNLLLFWLLPLTAGMLLFNRKIPRLVKKTWGVLLALSLLYLFIFSTLLKWQPWHTRLLLPSFLFLSYAIVLVMTYSGFFRPFRLFVLSVGLLCIIFHASQPLLPYYKITKSFGSRTGDYFDRLPSVWNSQYPFRPIHQAIGKNATVGIICKLDDVVFPYMHDARSGGNRFYYLSVSNNPTAVIRPEVTEPMFLLVNTESDDWKRDSLRYKEYTPVGGDTQKGSWILKKRSN